MAHMADIRRIACPFPAWIDDTPLRLTRADWHALLAAARRAERPRDPLIMRKRPLWLACAAKQPRLVATILACCPAADLWRVYFFNTEVHTCLGVAVRVGASECVRLLLQDSRLDPSACSVRAIPALNEACHRGSVAIVKQLCAHKKVLVDGVPGLCRRLPPLWCALMRCQNTASAVEIASILLDHPRFTPLTGKAATRLLATPALLCRDDAVARMQLLLTHRNIQLPSPGAADAGDAGDVSGAAPELSVLHSAVRFGRLSVIRRLLRDERTCRVTLAVLLAACEQGHATSRLRTLLAHPSAERHIHALQSRKGQDVETALRQQVLTAACQKVGLAPTHHRAPLACAVVKYVGMGTSLM